MGGTMPATVEDTILQLNNFREFAIGLEAVFERTDNKYYELMQIRKPEPKE